MTPNIFIPFLQPDKYTHTLAFRVILYIHMYVFYYVNAYNYFYKILILIKSTSIDA